MGSLVKTMIDGGVNLGVRTRQRKRNRILTGQVADFEIVTVDILAQPVHPMHILVAIYEGLLNMRNGHKVLEMARDANGDVPEYKNIRRANHRPIQDLKI